MPPPSGTAPDADPDRDRHLRPESTELRGAITGLRTATLSLSDELTQRFFNIGHAPAWVPLGR